MEQRTLNSCVCVASVRVQTSVACICCSACADAWRRMMNRRQCAMGLRFSRRNLKIGATKIKALAYLPRESLHEYGSTVWDPYKKKDIDKVEKKVQRCPARFVLSQHKKTSSVNKMLLEFNWPTHKTGGMQPGSPCLRSPLAQRR